MAVVLEVSGLKLRFHDTFEASALLTATARLLHYVAALGGGLLLVLHVYLGTVAYPGTARGMIDGRVTRRWAQLHHPRWHEDQTRSS
jgi:cytochrome b subunit of formate dehydrogenase